MGLRELLPTLGCLGVLVCHPIVSVPCLPHPSPTYFKGMTYIMKSLGFPEQTSLTYTNQTMQKKKSAANLDISYKYHYQ